MRQTCYFRNRIVVIVIHISTTTLIIIILTIVIKSFTYDDNDAEHKAAGLLDRAN